MCTEKKSIMTEHNGTKYRSRLEARFAIFLEELSISFEYETEGFELSDGTKYLPDFYLPGYDRWVECKGVMEEYDAHKIEILEKDFCTHMIIVDQSLNLFLSDGTPLYLDYADFTTEPIELKRVIDALDYAKHYSFGVPQKDEFSVKANGTSLTRLVNLKTRYLQDAWYSVDYPNEKIINVVNDTRSGVYKETNFRIEITCDVSDFRVTLYYKQKEIFSINVLENEVKDACYKIFRMAFELLEALERRDEWRPVFYRKVQEITEWVVRSRV